MDLSEMYEGGDYKLNEGDGRSFVIIILGIIVIMAVISLIGLSLGSLGSLAIGGSAGAVLGIAIAIGLSLITVGVYYSAFFVTRHATSVSDKPLPFLGMFLDVGEK